MNDSLHYPGPLLLTIAHIESIRECSYDAARREHRAVRDALGGKDKKYLTVSEYCKHVKPPFDQVMAFLRGEGPRPQAA